MSHSQNQGRKRLGPIQQRGDTVVWSRDGRPTDVQRASQSMNEKGQGSRSPTACTQEDPRNRPRAGKSVPRSLRSSGRVGCMRALVGLERDRRTRGSSTRTQSASLIKLGRPLHNANGSTYEIFRAHTCASCPGRQAARIYSEARKCAQWLDTEGNA
jgi:hypothetical protein